MSNTDRESETRGSEELDASQAVPSTWRPPGKIPTPEQMPGFKLAWKRVAMRGEADSTNWSTAMQEGWRPVAPSEQPKLAFLVEAVPGAPTDKLEVGGLVLCKIPSEVAKQRDDYYENLAQRQVQSVDERLQSDFAGDKRVKLVNESSSSFGRGTI